MHNACGVKNCGSTCTKCVTIMMIHRQMEVSNPWGYPQISPFLWDLPFETIQLLEIPHLWKPPNVQVLYFKTPPNMGLESPSKELPIQAHICRQLPRT